MTATQELGGSKEDYLEAIYLLVREKAVARCRDISDRLKVNRSSVTGALQALAKRGLVKYEPYEFATLTNEGKAVAERIVWRHETLIAFFRDVLGTDKGSAEADACRIEHAIGERIMRRLSGFVEFMQRSSVPAKELPLAFREHYAQERHDNEGNHMPGGNREMNARLADLKPGAKAKVIRVSGAAAANGRLMEMGLTRRAMVTVVRVAPLGDPVEVEVRGYNLSLRKTEARAVEVERDE
ncbi:MAG: metal-dependent transcriptional regulator [Verrucomicrobiota bacterium]|nr:metal-dependent transcriptional regulator [Verrucomicrobiota bacterium]